MWVLGVDVLGWEYFEYFWLRDLEGIVDVVERDNLELLKRLEWDRREREWRVLGRFLESFKLEGYNKYMF